MRLRFGEVAGRFDCVSIELIGQSNESEQHPITSLTLRRLPLGRFVEQARREYRRALEDARLSVGTGSWNPTVSTAERKRLVAAAQKALTKRRAHAERTTEVPRRGRRPTYGPEHYAQVAEAYRNAWAAGDHPTKAVAERFGTSRSAAAKWVAKPRELGLLPSTTQGRPRGASTPGGRSRRKKH